MGTISDKLMRIINTKEDIRQALISKGYDVPTSIPFKEYAKMISDLPCRVDSFPDIEGIVARYSVLGLTNEQMATNPVWVDKTGNGHDLQLKNFAWKGMSGVGGYGDENYQTFYKFTLDDYVFIASPPGVKHMNFTFRVTGLQPGNKLTLAYFGTTNTVYGTWDKDGIYTVDADIVEAGKPTYFYNEYGATRGEFTIEILPLYPGFILGDGVDDFAVTEKELNFEDTYTVYTAFIPFQNDPARNMILCGKNDTKDFSINYSGTHLNFKPSTGVNLAVRIDQFALLVCKRNKDITTIINLSTGESRSLKSVEFISNPGLYYLWRNMFATFHAKAAIAGQTICNGYFSTDEDDEKVLNWYKKQYPWLFPYQAWTVTGKTNEDKDRATIANITGNGNDLVLLNFGFAEGSGYGLYETNFMNWVDSHRATFTRTSSKINVTAVLKEEYATFTYSTESRLKQRIKVTGLPEGVSLILGRTNFVFYTIAQDGIYDIDVTDDSGSSSPIIGYRINKILDSCDITIEQIPEYEGYLVTDGVDDRVTSSSFTLNKNWTIVGNWKMLQPEANKLSGIVKQNSLFIYNSVDGLNISINDAWNFFKLKDIRSVNAICSDGRIYLNDWTEIIDSKQQTVNESVGTLVIGILGNVYTSLAFKNLSFYNNQNLSKDDCIKAYNYLQTLKAK